MTFRRSSWHFWTSLHLIFIADELDTVKELIDNGADVNFEDNDGFNPLHTSSRNGNWILFDIELNIDILFEHKMYEPTNMLEKHWHVEQLRTVPFGAPDIKETNK